MKQFKEYFEGSPREWVLILMIAGIMMMIMAFLPCKAGAEECKTEKATQIEVCTISAEKSIDISDALFWELRHCDDEVITVESADDAGVLLVEAKLNAQLKEKRCCATPLYLKKRLYTYSVVSLGPHAEDNRWRVLTATITKNQKIMKQKLVKICADNTAD